MAFLDLKPKKTKNNNGLSSPEAINAASPNEPSKLEQLLSKRTRKLKPALVDIPRFWSWSFLLLTLIYLTAEALFNTELVSVMGGAGVNQADRDAVEFFGRVVSSSGAALLFSSLLITPLWHRQIIKKKLYAIMGLFVVFSLIWPSVFYGQKWFLEEKIINSSTAQERQRALFSQTVKDALIVNAVDIEGIPYSAKDYTHTPSEMTFIALLPALMYSDTDLVNKIDKQKDKVIRNFYTNKFHLGFDQIYGAFKTIRTNLVAKYQDYSDKSNAYIDALNSSGKETQKVIDRIEERMSASFNEYAQVRRGLQNDAKARSKKAARDFYRYMKDRNRLVTWKNWPKLEKHDARFEKKMREEGFGGVHRSYFFSDKDTFTDSPEHMRKKLLGLMYAKFERREGYPAYLNKSEFIAHPEIQKKLRQNLSNEGLKLPKGWTKNDKRSLSKAVREKIKTELDQKWASNELTKAYGLVPNMTWKEFYSTPKVQQSIKEELKVDQDFGLINLDWNNTNFKRYFIDPMITNETRKLSRSLDKPLSEFSNGGVQERESKDALKATILPAFSMAISLGLVILTLLRLPVGLLIDLVTSPKHKILIRFIAPVVMLVVIVLYPLMSSAARSNTTVNYLLNAVKTHASASESFALEWIINSQPMVYPIGKFIENVIPISDSIMTFAGASGSHIPTGNPLEKLTEEQLKALGLIPQEGAAGIFEADASTESNQQVISDKKSAATKTDDSAIGSLENDKAKQTEAKKPQPVLYPLTITSTPPETKIRVMNIGPKYQAGMMLSPGDYIIEVSASGYQTQTRSVALTKEQQQFAFTLAKVPNNEPVKPKSKEVEKRSIGINGQPISAAAADLSFVWNGYYNCGRKIRADYQITALGGNKIEVLTTFQATADTVGIVKSLGEVNGRNFVFDPGEWVAKPNGYRLSEKSTSGTLSADKLSISGRIDEDGCTDFVAYKKQ